MNSDRDDILARIAERTIPRAALLTMFEAELRARGVPCRLQPLKDNCTGRFLFARGSVVLDAQRETYDGEPVWRARWRIEEPPQVWPDVLGMYAFHELVSELGPWFIDQPLVMQAAATGPVDYTSKPRVPELTARDLEHMRLRQRGG